MKLLGRNSVIAIFTFVSCEIHAQNQSLKDLMGQIDNKDAYVVMLKTISPRIHSAAAQQIASIGKSATPDLIAVLESDRQGIIAHFILSEIWNEKWTEALCCEMYTDGNAEIITINGLEIRIQNNELSASAQELKNNKARWKIIAAS